MMSSKSLLLVAAAMLIVCSTAFTKPLQQHRMPTTTVVAPSSRTASTTALQERRWNFNEGQSPWGLKKNAEIWNGRVSQMGFLVVFLQELITGKGVVAGLQEGDTLSFALLGGTVLSVVGLTAWLAIKGDDDYTN